MCCVKIEEPPTERRILSLGLNRYALQNVMPIERTILETDNTAFFRLHYQINGKPTSRVNLICQPCIKNLTFEIKTSPPLKPSAIMEFPRHQGEIGSFCLALEHCTRIKSQLFHSWYLLLNLGFLFTSRSSNNIVITVLLAQNSLGF